MSEEIMGHVSFSTPPSPEERARQMRQIEQALHGTAQSSCSWPMEIRRIENGIIIRFKGKETFFGLDMLVQDLHSFIFQTLGFKLS